MSVASAAADALARNDRYLHEFVEKFALCPFAKECRESGALERRVLPHEALDADATAATLAEISTPAFAHVEIGLLLFPALRVTFAEFEHFAAALRVRHQPLTFYVVPFHPDSPPDHQDPGRLVSLLRRSPDPTLQLVRASLLERVRGLDTEDTRWVDPATLDLHRPPKRSPPSMSTRIAEANFETARRVGVHTLLELLASMRPR